MSEKKDTNEDEHSVACENGSGGQIFADEAGKEVFDAFEKLGNELNNLTDNLERQFEEAEDGDDPLGSFDFKGFLAASIQEHNKPTAKAPTSTNHGQSSTDLEVEDIIALLNDQQLNLAPSMQSESYDEEQQSDRSPSHKGHVKRDSTGASSMDADSIASGGSHLPKKISALINSMRIRSQSMDESSTGGGGGGGVGVSVTLPTGDEWENDDDCGYTVITLSEEEFFDYEEVCTALDLNEFSTLPLANVRFICCPFHCNAGNKRQDSRGAQRASSECPGSRCDEGTACQEALLRSSRRQRHREGGGGGGRRAGTGAPDPHSRHRVRCRRRGDQDGGECLRTLRQRRRGDRGGPDRCLLFYRYGEQSCRPTTASRPRGDDGSEQWQFCCHF